MKERLQKIIAQAGVDSRRHAEKLIAAGRVTVNGDVVTKMGVKADPQKDVIRIDGKTISVERNLYYIALYKPAECVTTLSDPENRKTVVDLVADVGERVYPVGRLDYDSSGLLLLTNDGAFAQKVQHPRYEIPKTYRVKIAGRLTLEEVKQISKGVPLSDGLFKPRNLKIEKCNEKSTWLSLTLSEGRNRIIRRGFEACGYRVTRLIREAIGKITLAGLTEGRWRHLTHQEIRELTGQSLRQKR